MMVQRIKLHRAFSLNPLTKGMLSYAIIWPCSSIAQEYIVDGTRLQEANLPRAARFGVFGAFFMAPVFYGWMKFSNKFFKGKSLKTAILRAAVEQITYTPLALTYFFFDMSLLEFKSIKECRNEVKEKLLPTYKIGIFFWPTAQTINFYFVKDTNRILFCSGASFIWTVYLAHMKAKETKGRGKVSKDSSQKTSA